MSIGVFLEEKTRLMLKYLPVCPVFVTISLYACVPIPSPPCLLCSVLGFG